MRKVAIVVLVSSAMAGGGALAHPAEEAASPPPDPVELDRSAQDLGSVACDDGLVLARSLLRTNARLTPEETNHALAIMGRAAADGACAERLGAMLLADRGCDRGANVVAFAVTSSPATPTRIVSALVRERATRSEACMRIVLPNVQHAAKVDRSLVESVAALADGSGSDQDSASLLVLGTLVHTARAANDTVAVDAGERVILRRLERPSAASIEAAGNAGCAACLPTVLAAAEEGDEEARRVAVGALRFVERRPATEAMCAALSRDASARVREHAAWALGLSADAEMAPACLRAATEHDPDPDVRRAAEQALDEKTAAASSRSGGAR